MNFSQKVVVVTGGANGIGKSIVTMFAEKGANVVIADIAEEAGEKLVLALKEKGLEARFISTDVRKVDEIERLMRTTFETYGRLHYLINNAGVSMK